MGNYKSSRKDAKRAERSVPICLNADLSADWEAADRELQRAQKESNNSLEGGGVGDLVDRVRDIEARMLENTEQYRLRALPRHEFRRLVAQHPPRMDENDQPNREDAQIGVNRDTFFHDLIKVSVVEPHLDDEDWAWLLGHTDTEREQLEAEGKADQIEEGILTHRQFGDLEDAAWFLNRGEVQVPFSRAASLARRNSDDE